MAVEYGNPRQQHDPYFFRDITAMFVNRQFDDGLFNSLVLHLSCQCFHPMVNNLKLRAIGLHMLHHLTSQSQQRPFCFFMKLLRVPYKKRQNKDGNDAPPEPPENVV